MLVLVIMMFLTQENIKTMFLVLLLIKLCVSITDIAKKLFCTEEEMLLINSLNQSLMSKTLAEE